MTEKTPREGPAKVLSGRHLIGGVETSTASKDSRKRIWKGVGKGVWERQHLCGQQRREGKGHEGVRKGVGKSNIMGRETHQMGVQMNQIFTSN